MRLRTFVFAAVALFGWTAAARAQGVPAIPDAGLKAEAIGNLDEAIWIYHGVLASDPSRGDLWVRIADIEASRGNLPACIDALVGAIKVAPASPALFSRLSQAYATAGHGSPALQSIEGALALKPNDPEYLRARAMLATWVGEYRRAQDSYRRLLTLLPDEVDLLVSYARVSAWAGDTDEAVAGFERYLRAKPEAAAVWLELARAESWRGNYASAARALDTYQRKFGASPEYSREVAAVLANGGRPGRAEDVLTPLMEAAPNDYNLNLTRTIALAQDHRQRDAFASLDAVRGLSPNARETRDAERLVRTLLASSAESGVTAYSDSDHLQIQRFAPQGTLSLLSGTRLSGGFETGRLDARRGSGLEAVDGATSAEFKQAWAGVAQTFAGRFTFAGRAGQASVDNHDITTYAAGFDARPADVLRVGFTRTHGLFVVSPRTVALGLTNTSNRAQLDWNPSFHYTVVFDGSYQELSDGNRRWELTIAPRRAVARTARLNVDLGFSAYRLETTQDLDHGYYDPRRYEFYAATAYPYFKIRENVGLGLSIAVGTQRDTSSPMFHFGGNLTGEATFGIYEPWAVKVNGSASINGRLETGAYSGAGAGVALVRRF